MKSIKIYEPVMCCNTGVSGVGIDSELMRMSKLMKIFMKHNLDVKRLDLSKTPKEFMENNEVMNLIKENKSDMLPITVVDNKIVLSGRYPSNEEFADFLDITVSVLQQDVDKENEETSTESGSCCS